MAAAPAGQYHLDKSHASLVLRVNHLGFSTYTTRFSRFDAELTFEPSNIAASKVSATIDASSFDRHCRSPKPRSENSALTAAAFEFIAMDLPPQEDFKLQVLECQPAETNAWGVPAYAFHLLSCSEQYMGRIRLRVGWNDDIIKYAGQIG
jgi:hypothetical protein